MAIDESLTFTIVMPAYNVSDYIEDAIHDVLEQTYPNWRLIIVDDCSTDQTGMIADAYADAEERICVIHHEKNRGVSAARNRGLAEAQGDYVLFLDPDDRYDLGLLETVAAAARRLRADMIVYSLEEDYYNARGGVAWYEPHYMDTAFYDCRKTLTSSPLAQDAVPLDAAGQGGVAAGQNEEAAGQGEKAEGISTPDAIASDRAHRMEEAMMEGIEEVTRPRRQMKQAQIGALGLDARRNMQVGHSPGYDTDPDAMHEAVAQLEHETMLGYPWNKAYRLQYLREQNLTFPDYVHIEDIMFNLSVCENMTTLVVLEDVLYGYRNQHQKRLTGKYLPDYLALQKTRIQAFLEQQERWDTLDDTVLSQMSAFYYRSYFSAIEREIAHKTSADAIRRMVEEEQESSLNKLLGQYLPDTNRAYRLLYAPLADGRTALAIRRARETSLVRRYMPGLFDRLKQIR